MSILDLFRKRTQDVFYTRVLICSIGEASEDELRSDYDAYRRHLESVTLLRLANVNQLVSSLRDKYDIVHVHCVVTTDGKIGDSQFTGTELIEQSAQWGVKLLWLASGNDPQGYIKNFKANGNRLNIVMTIDRRGNRLSNFIEKLLSEMRSGSSMPVAWAKIAPQIPGHEHPDMPGTIFYSGLGQVRFV